METTTDTGPPDGFALGGAIAWTMWFPLHPDIVEIGRTVKPATTPPKVTLVTPVKLLPHI